MPSPTISPNTGIGLRHPHYQEIIDTKPEIPWLEVHPENFFVGGGMSWHILEQIRTHYPMSFHGVGLSLGSTDPLNTHHLKQLKTLIDHFAPSLISEHLSWSSIDKVFLNDLLPLPYTEESLSVVCEHIEQTQEYLGRQILVENPSTYMEFAHSTISEHEFLREITKRSGCKLLLDINNIYVSHHNHGYNPQDYFKTINTSMIGEIHLAGHARRTLESGDHILIDHHGDVVCDAVWELYRQAIGKYGPIPTLIEWDTDIPALEVLLGEATKAETIIKKSTLSQHQPHIEARCAL